MTRGLDRSDMQTPLKRVQGLGSAKSGTHHHVVLRVTSIALVPLVIWVVYLALALVHADYAHARALLHHPFAAVWLIAFLVATLWHTQLGLQVVIEDYVHAHWLEALSQLVVKFVCAITALAGVVAVARIALT